MQTKHSKMQNYSTSFLFNFYHSRPIASQASIPVERKKKIEGRETMKEKEKEIERSVWKHDETSVNRLLSINREEKKLPIYAFTNFGVS